MNLTKALQKAVFWYTTGIILILVFVVDYFIEDYFLQQEIVLQREKAQNELTTLRARIEGVINANISLVQGFASVIASNPDIDQQYFARIGKDVIEKSSIIQNIAGAPDMVISLMYPLAGNEAALGLDYSKHPQQKTAALKVIETGKLVLAGPLQLQQGGIGFVARVPVYVTNAVSQGNNQLWGLLASVFNAEKLYQYSGLRDIDSNLLVAIKGRDAEGSSGAHFFGDKQIYQHFPVSEYINLPYGSWKLSAIPANGWLTQAENVWLIRGINLILAVILIGVLLLATINLEKQNQLKEGLKSSNARFTSVLDGMNAVVFVADMQSHEILYANPKAIATFGENLMGDKCWKRFQVDRNQPCNPCVNDELIDEHGHINPPLSREIQSDFNGIWYQCETQAIVWDEGRIARLEVATDISELKRNEQLLSEAHQSLESTAYFDSLTGLPNRRMLTTHFDNMVACKDDKQHQLIVCYLDLDGFKQINDSYGHEIGDHLLKLIAGRLAATLRENDVVARWGGDEFALVLQVRDMQEATELLNRVLARVTDSYSYNNYQFDISASIGVAVYSEGDRNIDALLRQADQAMYMAKQQGKQRFCFFDVDEDRKQIAIKEQINEISRAITDREMILYYQPKLSLSQAKVYGVEVLIRWAHPERGLVQPVDFLPHIRGTHVQTELDWWVIETAINQALQWQRHHVELSVSINVSPSTLQQDDFISRLINVLNDRQLKPGIVELEILESDVADINKISSVIQKLEKFNLSFALDDYGTGYSSLTYLRQLPVHTLKIDQSFVRDMLVDQDDLSIVEGVIGLARVFEREVIAEGVETIPHGIKLAQLGCYNLQGYCIARPMPLEQLNDWLARYQIPPEWMI